jgi:hypothetical protein
MALIAAPRGTPALVLIVLWTCVVAGNLNLEASPLPSIPPALPGQDLLSNRSGWIDSMHTRQARFDLGFTLAPDTLPVNFTGLQALCLPAPYNQPIINSLVTTCVSQAPGEPVGTDASSRYVQGLYVQALVTTVIVGLLVVGFIVSAALTPYCCPCSAGLGRPLQLSDLDDRSLPFQGKWAPPLTRLAFCVHCSCALVALVAVGALSGVSLSQLGRDESDTSVILRQLAGWCSTTESHVDSVAVSLAEQSNACLSLSSSLQEAGFPSAAQQVADIATQQLEPAMASLNQMTSQLSLTQVASSLESVASGFESARIITTWSAIGFEVATITLLLVLMLAALPRCKGCACCYRVSSAFLLALGLPIATLCFVALLPAATVLSDACVSPGTYMNVLILSFAGVSPPEMTTSIPPGNDDGPFANPATLMTNTMFYFGDDALLTQMLGAERFGAGTCGVFSNGSFPRSAPALTLAGVMMESGGRAQSAWSNLVSLNASLSEAPPSVQSQVASLLQAMSGLEHGIATLQGDVGCGSVRGMFQAALQPVCNDTVGGVVVPMAWASLIVMVAFLCLGCVTTPLTAHHPAEAFENWKRWKDDPNLAILDIERHSPLERSAIEQRRPLLEGSRSSIQGPMPHNVGVTIVSVTSDLSDRMRQAATAPMSDIDEEQLSDHERDEGQRIEPSTIVPSSYHEPVLMLERRSSPAASSNHFGKASLSAPVTYAAPPPPSAPSLDAHHSEMVRGVWSNQPRVVSHSDDLFAPDWEEAPGASVLGPGGTQRRSSGSSELFAD